jgi:NodT family efflux transporter outer membrane factor (OMF) lipoprotein
MRGAMLAVVLLGGCTVGPAYVRPEVAAAPAAAVATDVGWWAGFDDPQLARLVGAALANNTDVAQAAARIAVARAAARAAGAALLPTIDATGGVTTLRQSRDTAIGRVTQALGVGQSYTEYSVGAEASWEIDLFGGLRRGREATGADLAASAADAAAVRVAVAAETADAYLTLRALQARLAVAVQQEGNETLLLGLVRQRFAEGIAAEREVNRTTADLDGVRAGMAPLRAGVAAQVNRLAVLTGTLPGSAAAALVTTGPIPLAPLPGDVPADLLRRRPDVAAAERRLAASNARIGVAVADYYPKVSLAGLVGVASLGTANLFTGGAVQASGGAALRWRLFDFGRVDAEVAAARGREAEALAAWRGTALVAAEEVETSLVRLAEAHRQRGDLAAQVAALSRARAQAQDAYAGGIVGLIEVTDADRELLRAADALAAARADEARAAVAVYRALGGGWSPASPTQAR